MSGFDFNQVTLSGNLTRDPELRDVGDAQVCGLRIAANERHKDPSTGEWGDRSMFFNVSIWRGLGTWVANNCKKGDQIAVTGRLRWREYEKDGQKREVIEIVADAVMPRTRSDRPNVPNQSANSSVRSTEGAIPTDIPADTAGLASPVVGGEDDVPF